MTKIVAVSVNMTDALYYGDRAVMAHKAKGGTWMEYQMVDTGRQNKKGEPLFNVVQTAAY